MAVVRSSRLGWLMAQLCRLIGTPLRRPAFLRVPALLLRLAFGEMAEDLMLAGQRALPKQAEETGYQFLYPTLPGALREIVG
jgi:NAD dependent epimerase/dehydratase family enzyme